MKKKILCLLALFACALLLFSACAPAYEGDARLGTYAALGADGKTVVYRLTLEADGTGVIIHYPTIGGEESEDVIFEIDGDTLYLHGTLAKENDAYTVELASDAGTPLANFVQE